MEKVIPVLRVSDYDTAVAFYVKWLGFKIDWEDKPDDRPFTIQISFRENIVLQLLQFTKAQNMGTWVLIEDFKNLISYRKILSMKPGNFPIPRLRHLPNNYSMLSVTFVDPFKNRIELRQKN